MQRKHHSDRESHLEAFLLGAAIASETVRGELTPTDFVAQDVVVELQQKNQGFERLKQWLDDVLGVELTNGDKVLDAAVKRLVANAVLREMERSGQRYEAIMVRFNEACKRRRKGNSQ